MPHQVDGQDLLTPGRHEGRKGHHLVILVAHDPDRRLIDVVGVKEAQGEAFLDLGAEPAVGNFFQFGQLVGREGRLFDGEGVAFPVKFVHQRALGPLFLAGEGKISEFNQPRFTSLDEVKAKLVQEHGDLAGDLVEDQLVVVLVGHPDKLTEGRAPGSGVADRIPHDYQPVVFPAVHEEELVMLVLLVVVDSFIAQEGQVTGGGTAELVNDGPNPVSVETVDGTERVPTSGEVPQNQEHQEETENQSDQPGEPDTFAGEEEKVGDVVFARVLGSIDHADDHVEDKAAGEDGAVDQEFADGVLELFPVENVPGH